MKIFLFMILKRERVVMKEQKIEKCVTLQKASPKLKALYSKINSKIDNYIQKIMNKYVNMKKFVYSDDGITRENLK